ncbi:MAG: hypothetical protein PHO08_08105 [Methylococcales bacterium]|nr:hypothetical protein [Methylococcales bacterium]
MTLNPFCVGDCLCYGEAVEITDGFFAAYYFVNRKLPNGEVQSILEKRRFGLETYQTPDLAELYGESAGQAWVLQSQYKPY